MKLECNISQPFGANANPSYAGEGLKGHTGVDTYCGYGTDVHSAYDGLVYKVLKNPQDAFDGSGYTAVFILVTTPFETFEYSVGHLNPTVIAGQFIKKGDKIGTEANHGEVYAGTEHITLAMQAAGDTRGSHRHNQKRIVKKVRSTEPGKFYLTSFGGGYYYDDNYYEIVDIRNGYDGCVDMLPPLFSRDLYYGKTGYDVECLQRFLGIEKTGFYGILTTAAVAKFQYQNHISPTLGFCGPKTRELLNSLN